MVTRDHKEPASSMHLRLPRFVAALTAGTVLAFAPGFAAAQTTPSTSTQPCTFSQNFRALHDVIPDVVGDCIGSAYSTGGYTTNQVTTRGLLTWVSQPNPHLEITTFTPDEESDVRYSLAGPTECPQGIYLPAGVCVSVIPTIEIPQSAIDAGYSAKALCEKDGKGVLLNGRSCLLQRPNG
jgi:hypothetical protein